MKKEDILEHKFDRKHPAKPFDYRTVPHVIMFVTRGNRKTPLRPSIALEQNCTLFNVVLFNRKYRQELTTEEEVAIVREARQLPESTVIDIVFSGHPKSFFYAVCTAWKLAYRRNKPSEVAKIQKVLDLIGNYDPRRGDEFHEWQEL